MRGSGEGQALGVLISPPDHSGPRLRFRTAVNSAKLSKKPSGVGTFIVTILQMGNGGTEG